MRTHRTFGLLCVAALVAGATLTAALASPAPATSSVLIRPADPSRADARESLLYIAGEYRKIAATNRFGPGLDTMLDRVTGSVSAMSDEESALTAERFGPLIDRMLSDLGVLQRALESATPSPRSSANLLVFPNAEYPTVDLGNIILTVTSTDLPDLSQLLDLINPLDPGPTPGIPQIPNSIIPGKCYGDPDGDGVPTRTPESLLLYTRIGLQGLELTNAIAKDVCGQDLGALGFQGNLSVVCILFDVAYLVPRFLYDNVTQCEGFIDGAEASASYQRLEYLHGEMGEVKTGIAGLGTTLAGGLDQVNDKLDTANGKLDTLSSKADLILANQDRDWQFLNSFRELSVRIAIEHALTANGVDKVSLFQLPEAHGGYLEVVRQVVLETIQRTRAAGQPVFNAQRELDKGNAAFQRGAFKAAYDLYRKAYVEAVK